MQAMAATRRLVEWSFPTVAPLVEPRESKLVTRRL
jgi:hypothetical protein